jgi:hypothetical protein
MIEDLWQDFYNNLPPEMAENTTPLQIAAYRAFFFAGAGALYRTLMSRAADHNGDVTDADAAYIVAINDEIERFFRENIPRR